ncbi:MAG TPA: hypothetical protein VFR38_12475 [Gaiellaceae bacterium]|nr:hypothetical protein [Gaiellaceae bacterium]
MRPKTLPLVILVASLAALVASVGWAATRDGNHGWTMMRYGAAGMMGYAADGGDRVRGLADAKLQAQRFAAPLDLEVGEVMRFTNHYYAELEERDGRPATEVLVEPETGAVYLEYGPAMMWNTRYGMMSDFRLRGSEGMMGGGMMGGGSTGGMMGGSSSGGMMGGSGGMMGGGYADPTWTPGVMTGDVSAAKARALATQWLSGRGNNLTAGDPEAFPGYYTLHVLRDGRIAGMLSVNAATGSVWSHWWHGRFVSMLEA